jgi:hypothetical protein
MIVGFTGTSRGMTPAQREAVRQWLWSALTFLEEVHHGDCVGADAEFHELARWYGVDVILHPPEDPKARAWCKGAVRSLPERPYLERNRDIAGACSTLLAAPHQVPMITRSGTWATVRHGMKLGRRVVIFTPSGEVW